MTGNEIAAILTAAGAVVAAVVAPFAAAKKQTRTNREHGAKKDEARAGELATMQLAIIEKLDEHRKEIGVEIRLVRDTVMLRIDEVEACAVDAQRDATAALAHAIGPDGKNGLRGDVRKIEGRLEEIDHERRSGEDRRLANNKLGVA